MKVAIVGCAHGEIEHIYESIQTMESNENYKVNLLICCGDYQSVRNPNDLECMARPKKYDIYALFISNLTFYEFFIY